MGPITVVKDAETFLSLPKTDHGEIFGCQHRRSTRIGGDAQLATLHDQTPASRLAQSSTRSDVLASSRLAAQPRVGGSDLRRRPKATIPQPVGQRPHAGLVGAIDWGR